MHIMNGGLGERAILHGLRLPAGHIISERLNGEIVD
jgi:hypothetical protein